METIIGIIILFSAIYIAWGIRIIKQKEFLVVERLGKFHRIAHAGITILCLHGLIDSEKHKNHLRLRRTDLYADEKDNKIDFKDGSCPVKIQVWWKIGRIGSKKTEDINDDIFNFVYAAENPENKLEEMIDDLARPLLQCMTIDEAGKEKDKVEAEIINEAASNQGVGKSLLDIGIYLDPTKGCLITDIILTNEVIKIREKTMEGEKEATKAAKRGAGYAQAIAAIMGEAKKAGATITFKEAREIYEKQRGLETVGETGANITFVSPGIQGLMTTLGIGQTGNAKNKKGGGS